MTTDEQAVIEEVQGAQIVSQDGREVTFFFASITEAEAACDAFSRVHGSK
jgi:hypothetical protein